MSETSLQFRVTFYSLDAGYAENFKQDVEKFFEQCNDSDVKYTVLCDMQKQVLKNFIYEENIIYLNIILDYHESVREINLGGALLKKICKKWCEYCRTEKFLYWLMPLNNEHIYLERSKYDCLLKTTAFDFGTMPDMEHFVQHFFYKARKSPLLEIMTSFHHGQGHFLVCLQQEHKPECHSNKCFYVFKVTYKSLSRVIINITSENNPIEFYFVYNYPVEVTTLASERNDNFENYGFSAISDACRNEYIPEKYERVMKFGCTCTKSLKSIKAIGRSCVLKLCVADRYRAHHAIQQLITYCDKKTNFYYSSVKVITRNITSNFSYYSHLPRPSCYNENFAISEEEVFNCEYAWKSVSCYSSVVTDQFIMTWLICGEMGTGAICKAFKSYMIANPAALCKALFSISEMVAKNVFFMFQDALNKLFHYFCELKELDVIFDGICLVRSVIVTPSRLLFFGPREHFSNRIIRKFGSEYMLRVSFLDDNFSSLNFMLQHHSQADTCLNYIVKHFLHNGFKVGNRHYFFLAASNSQLREHGLWMYANDMSGNTAIKIRDWMGDFSMIKSVAKYMARMGQCFSSSESAAQVELTEENEIHLDDIITDNGYYIISDGIGMISEELADEVRENLRKNYSSMGAYKPCAFQIRYKGCKGMVCENPLLSGRVLGIRPSMKKFECSTSSHLEVVKVSAPRSLFLNRHLITILEQLGIGCNVFMTLLKDMIINSLDSLLYRNKAVDALTTYSSIPFPYSELNDVGFNFMDDPFFRLLLLSFYGFSIEAVKNKSRIAVPNAYGRNMLGVLDETATLKYGEVFVQISEKIGCTNSDLHVIEGSVVVSKNPCMHPGDVRKFNAVNVRSLRHIKDCIVFPCVGERPHPDEMAGSDLDGDEYIVLWYPALIFEGGNLMPMIYPMHSEVKHCGPIKVENMIDFFCSFIKNSGIGVFGNAFLVAADKEKDGIFSEICLRIASKYPYVLDFAKTGKTESLSYQERPKKYPDFMEKRSLNDSYYSERALGVLYRTTREIQGIADYMQKCYSDYELDPMLNFPGWEKYAESAERHKALYNDTMHSILRKFNLNTEIDIFSMWFCSSNMYHQNSYEQTQTKSVAEACVLNLMKKYKNIFLQECQDELCNKELNSAEIKISKYRRASAWYMVSYADKTSKIFSMPWILADVLIDIRKECLSLQNVKIPNNIFTFKDNEIFLKSKFTGKKNILSASFCLCFPVAVEILNKWIVEISSQRGVCYEQLNACFSNAFEVFLSKSKNNCCSYCTTEVSCSCSPLKIIIDFLKFSISYSSCEVSSENGILQSASLVTLSDFAVSHNLKYLGLVNFENKLQSDSFYNYAGTFKSDIVRIGIHSKYDQTFIENYIEVIETYLKEKSGVKHVSITTDHDRNNNWFLMIRSIGYNFQRWNLEDIVLDKHFLKKMRGVIADSQGKKSK